MAHDSYGQETFSSNRRLTTPDSRRDATARAQVRWPLGMLAVCLLLAAAAGCTRPVPPPTTPLSTNLPPATVMATAVATVDTVEIEPTKIIETTEPAMQDKGVVIVGVANVYKEPSKAVELVTQAIVGTEVAIWETRQDWYYVRLPDLYQGWIEAASVRRYPAGEAAYASQGQVAEVVSLLAFVYLQPRVSTHPPVLTAPLGARLEVQSEEDTWLRVVLPDHASRWIQKGDVTILPAGTPRPRGSGQDVVNLAKRFLGVPYLWGGTTAQGIDCSGLAQLAYHLNGVEMLRDADMQYNQPGLEPVARENLRTGDLLFFGESSITHMGIYIDDGQFIHATTYLRPVVQLSSLDEPRWTELYQGARRP